MQNNYQENVVQEHIINNINPQTKHADVYSFDDLLISCGHEAMTNGIRSKAIPGTIQDWISGKICEALPHRLVQRLLAYLIENRDATEVLEYRESKGGDVPELTLLFHRSVKAKARKQREGYQHVNLTGSINDECIDTDLVSNTGSVVENNLFRSGTVELEDDGLKFFSEEMIVSSASTGSQSVPTNENIILKRKKPIGLDDLGNIVEEKRDKTFITVKGKARDFKIPLSGGSRTTGDRKDCQKPKTDRVPKSRDTSQQYKKSRRNTCVFRKVEASESEVSDGDNSEVDENSDDQDRNPLWKNDNDVVPKTLKSRKYYQPSVLQQKVQCHLCEQIFKRNSILFSHQRQHHADYWATRPTPGKGYKRGGWLDKDKLLCNICEDYKTSKIEEMDAHYENEHPDFWQMKLQNNAGWRGSLVRLKLSNMPEISYDEEADMFTCTICSKQWRKGNQMVAHVERVHMKILGYQCEVCGNKFATATAR